MASSGFVGCEKPGGLNHEINVQFAPRELRRVTFGEALDAFAVEDDCVAIRPHFTCKASVGGVVFEQIREIVGWHKVVDRHKFKAGILASGPQHHAANAAKSVDANAKSHVVPVFGLSLS